MPMEKIKQVLQKLTQQQLSPHLKTEQLMDRPVSTISWTENPNENCFIQEEDIALEGNKIAWFQSSDQDRHLLTIYNQDTVFTWTPITYNPVFGCYCILLEWYKEHVLFVYQEKHDIYICCIKEGEVRYFNFHGEEIERKGAFISYETYTNKTDKVRLLKIPELIEVTPLEKDEAEKLGLIPKGLNRPGNFLGNNE